jgi:hypothetical protein
MNIVQSGNRSWKYKVSHRRYWLAFKACQGSQGQLTLFDGAAPGLCVDFALAVRSCVFCASVESCWLQPVKSKVTQLKLTDPSASSIHFALPMESVYNIQTPVHLQLGQRPYLVRVFQTGGRCSFMKDYSSKAIRAYFLHCKSSLFR